MTAFMRTYKGKACFTKACLAGVYHLAVIVAWIVFIVILQDGERRIPVQYAKK